MSWLIVAVLSYLILAVVFLIDKHLLTEKIPDPGLYAFYTGILSVFVFTLIPFIGFLDPSFVFFVPSFYGAFLAFLVGANFIFALYLFYKALHKFEASRVVPVIGALSPVFSFIIILVLTKEDAPDFLQYLALIMLVLGSFLITFQKGEKIFLKSFFASAWAALFFATFFVLQKKLFETLNDFWNPLIWMSLGSLFVAIFLFLFSKKIRNEVFVKRETFYKKTALVFFLNKGLSGIAGLLQRWAIFLTPTYVAVPFIQGLQGIQYAFLFVLILILSRTFPRFAKEKISGKIIIQKSLAIALICVGLAILFNVFD